MRLREMHNGIMFVLLEQQNVSPPFRESQIPQERQFAELIKNWTPFSSIENFLPF